MRSQHVVGERATVQPGHQRKRQEQPEPRNQPQRQRHHPAHCKEKRRADTVLRGFDKTVATEAREIGIVARSDEVEHQRQDENRGQQYCHRVAHRQDQQPAAERRHRLGQPLGAPFGKPAHRRLRDEAGDQVVEQGDRHAHHQHDGNQRRYQDVQPDLALPERRQTAPQRHNDFTHDLDFASSTPLKYVSGL